MVEAVLAGLVQNLHGTYVDATFGRGGHANCLLKLLAEDARLIAMDRDPEAVEAAYELSAIDSRVQVSRSLFSELNQRLQQNAVDSCDGVLFDCGVSSPQLEDPQRGFSFQRIGPLDMRMDPSTGMTAADWLNSADEREISSVIYEYGDERNARAIAREIVKRRPLRCTHQLAQIVVDLASRVEQGKHPATRTFQAIRMKINDELQELEAGISQAFDSLRVGGRLAIITFHSLEHRLVRRKFREFSVLDVPRGLPVKGDLKGPGKLVVKKAQPSYLEVAKNPRARSAMLQIIERIAETEKS